jgi:hypothetical protein
MLLNILTFLTKQKHRETSEITDSGRSLFEEHYVSEET